MTSRFSSVALDCADPKSLAEFWCGVLGWQVLEAEDEIVSIGPADEAEPTMDLIRVPDPKTAKNRLHLDLRANDDAAVELQRLYDLGARPVDVGQGTDVTWTVLADPEDNEFCLLSSRTPDAA